jgi:dienelactone hydrolase
VSPPATVGRFALVERPAGAGWSWPVYQHGDGPPVVVIHELPGLTPAVVAYGERLAGSGLSVWLPVLYGRVPSTTQLDQAYGLVRICVSREITAFRSGRTSKVVTPLRALARHAVTVTGARGAGVVGMCFSGGFAIAAAADEAVLAGVAAQPSLPFRTPWTPGCVRDLGLSPDHLAAVRGRVARGDTELYVTRFTHDTISPPERFEAVGDLLGREGVTFDPVDSSPGNPEGFTAKDHSVLAFAPAKHPEGPAAERLARTAADVAAFLHRRLDPVRDPA